METSNKPRTILTPDVIKDLKDSFRYLGGDVAISVHTRKGTNDAHNALAVQLVSELAAFEPRIKPDFHEIGDAESSRLGIDRSPTILVAPERYSIRFTGVPLGEEGRSFVMTLLMASTGGSMLSEASLKRIANLKDPRRVRVFVSPT